jgi:hypothetical protein
MTWPKLPNHRGGFAAWALRRMDERPDRRIVIDIPYTGTSNEIEQAIAREFDQARHERPDLVIGLMPTASTGAPLRLAVHEHHWVGGHCIHCNQPPDS